MRAPILGCSGARTLAGLESAGFRSDSIGFSVGKFSIFSRASSEKLVPDQISSIQSPLVTSCHFRMVSIAENLDNFIFSGLDTEGIHFLYKNVIFGIKESRAIWQVKFELRKLL